MLLRRQLSLLLNGQTEAEADALWRGLPPCSRQEITLLYARQIGYATKPATSTPAQRETDDEHTETEASDEHHQ